MVTGIRVKTMQAETNLHEGATSFRRNPSDESFEILKNGDVIAVYSRGSWLSAVKIAGDE